MCDPGQEIGKLISFVAENWKKIIVLRISYKIHFKSLKKDGSLSIIAYKFLQKGIRIHLESLHHFCENYVHYNGCVRVLYPSTLSVLFIHG